MPDAKLLARVALSKYPMISSPARKKSQVSIEEISTIPLEPKRLMEILLYVLTYDFSIDGSPVKAIALQQRVRPPLPNPKAKWY